MINIDIEKKLNAYEGQQVLKVTRQFFDESIIKVYGPSGAGKTTFLKIMAGFTKPDKGIIKVDGIIWLNTQLNISLTPQKRMAGFVFQDYALFPNMSVLQHLQYATGDQTWIKRLLNIGKLETLAHYKPHSLSGGQQQRLAILRALAIKPKLLLMDEPFSALDPEMKSILINNLKVVFTELKTTVFVVSHNPQELDEISTDSVNTFEILIKSDY